MFVFTLCPAMFNGKIFPYSCIEFVIHTEVMWLVVTEVWSESFGLVRERRHEIGLLCAVSHIFAYIGHHWLYRTSYFSLSSVVSCDFSALYVYSTYKHHPHQLGYPCAKFRSCGDLHCWASPCRKIAYSINQSLTHLAYLMPREPKLLLRKDQNN